MKRRWFIQTLALAAGMLAADKMFGGRLWGMEQPKARKNVFDDVDVPTYNTVEEINQLQYYAETLFNTNAEGYAGFIHFDKDGSRSAVIRGRWHDGDIFKIPSKEPTHTGLYTSPSMYHQMHLDDEDEVMPFLHPCPICGWKPHRV